MLPPKNPAAADAAAADAPLLAEGEPLLEDATLEQLFLAQGAGPVGADDCPVVREETAIIISLSGPHGTDIVGALLESLAELSEAESPALSATGVYDVSFSRVHHNVTFTVLMRLPTSASAVPLGWTARLRARAARWDAVLRCARLACRTDKGAASANAKQSFCAAGTPPPTHPQLMLPPLASAPYANRRSHAATLLAAPGTPGLSTALLCEMTGMLLARRVSIERMIRLDNAHVASSVSSPSPRCFEFRLSVPQGVDLDEFRDALFQLARRHAADAALQCDNVFRRSKRLVVFDLDSTLIKQEVIDELAAFAGVSDRVRQVTDRAMRGEIPFTDSLQERVACLKGARASDAYAAVRLKIEFHSGARELCACLKLLGLKLAVISGGFMPLANFVKSELRLDYAFANTLTVDADGFFTGETSGQIVCGQRKAELLEVISQAEQILPEQVIAVGDGANDLPMLSRAGLGIAFNAKPYVQERAKTRMNQHNLCSILYLLGYNDDDIQELLFRSSTSST